MVSASRLLTVLIPLLLLGFSDGRIIWSPFMSEGGAVTQHSRQPDLCHHLLTVMEEVDTAAPLSCLTIPDSVGGNTCHRSHEYNIISLHMTS